MVPRERRERNKRGTLRSSRCINLPELIDPIASLPVECTQAPLSNAWSTNRWCYKLSPARYSARTGARERGPTVEGGPKNEKLVKGAHSLELTIGLAKRPIVQIDAPDAKLRR
jgi:hypothetical protein